MPAYYRVYTLQHFNSKPRNSKSIKACAKSGYLTNRTIGNHLCSIKRPSPLYPSRHGSHATLFNTNMTCVCRRTNSLMHRCTNTTVAENTGE